MKYSAPRGASRSRCYDSFVNIQSLSALLAAIVTFAIGSSVILHDRRQRAFRRFAALCFALVAWHVTTFLRITLESETAYFLSLFYSCGLEPRATARSMTLRSSRTLPGQW